MDALAGFLESVHRLERAAGVPPRVEDLRPGDVMLYGPVGFFGYVIAIKTWHRISHVEIYLGEGVSAASRDGLGVSRYPVRLSELRYVLRPVLPFNTTAAAAFINEWQGTRYGWLEILEFIGIPVRPLMRRLGLSTRLMGVVCSAFALMLYRFATGHQIMPTEDPNAVAPFELLFLVPTECFVFWSDASVPAGAAS